MRAILDASPIIAFFAEMREPEILLRLRRLGYELLVPDAVSRYDITREPSKTILAQSVASGSISLLPPVDPVLLTAFMNSHPSLGKGESEVILLAIGFRSQGEAALCVIDEKAARRVATNLGLPVKGTLGVLRTLRDSGLLDQEELTRLKGRLLASGFRADASLLR